MSVRDREEVAYTNAVRAELDRLVQERMKATGETYEVASSNLLAQTEKKEREKVVVWLRMRAVSFADPWEGKYSKEGQMMSAADLLEDLANRIEKGEHDQ